MKRILAVAAFALALSQASAIAGDINDVTIVTNPYLPTPNGNYPCGFSTYGACGTQQWVTGVTLNSPDDFTIDFSTIAIFSAGAGNPFSQASNATGPVTAIFDITGDANLLTATLYGCDEAVSANPVCSGGVNNGDQNQFEDLYPGQMRSGATQTDGYFYASGDGNPADGGLTATFTSDGTGGALLTVVDYPPLDSSSSSSATFMEFTDITAAPEPGSVLLMVPGLAGVALLLRRRRAV